MAMENQEMARRLKSLAQLDMDAVYAYEKAIGQIDAEAIREQLSLFRDDHNRHVRELSDKIRELGETPPDTSRDLKGLLIEGLTVVQSLLGTSGALIAMQNNEILTNARYKEAGSLDFRPDIRAVIERNYEDEKRHLQYIKDALSNQI